MDTTVFIIDPALTINNPELTEPFIAEFRKLVEKYGIPTILTDRVLKSETDGSFVTESYEDFIFHWDNYLSGGTSGKNKEIIISGAFPDCDEVSNNPWRTQL